MLRNEAPSSDSVRLTRKNHKKTIRPNFAEFDQFGITNAQNTDCY